MIEYYAVYDFRGMLVEAHKFYTILQLRSVRITDVSCLKNYLNEVEWEFDSIKEWIEFVSKRGFVVSKSNEKAINDMLKRTHRKIHKKKTPK